jgi:HD-GYP domain-containing protein (c-di-GMP phosphodiesterase class II)
MPDNIDVAVPLAGEIAIDVSQLRPGVHVRLPVPWMAHHFLFSSFVIADDDQVRQIAALQLPLVLCDVARCRVPPLPKAAPAPAKVEKVDERLAILAAQQMAAKIERTRVMTALRGRLDKAQQHFGSAAKEAGGAIRSFDAHPAESVTAVTKVSQDSAAALLADPDSALVLIAGKARDDGAAAHALSVMTLTLLIGKQARLPEEALRALGVGALLHDVGKLTLKPAILRNTERNKHEEAIYRSHCRLGYESALRAGNLSQPILDAILHHHERLDGTGFPDGLVGEGASLAARIVGIANRFDNLANPIDYRQALSPSEALARMWVKEQSAFDTVLLQLFIRAMGVYPPGSIVQLSDGRIGAVVTSAPTGNPLSPHVMIHAPEIPRSQALIIDLAQETSIRIDRSLRLQERPEDELDYLLPRRKLDWFHMVN